MVGVSARIALGEQRLWPSRFAVVIIPATTPTERAPAVVSVPLSLSGAASLVLSVQGLDHLGPQPLRRLIRDLHDSYRLIRRLTASDRPKTDAVIGPVRRSQRLFSARAPSHPHSSRQHGRLVRRAAAGGWRRPAGGGRDSSGAASKHDVGVGSGWSNYCCSRPGDQRKTELPPVIAWNSAKVKELLSLLVSGDHVPFQSGGVDDDTAAIKTFKGFNDHRWSHEHAKYGML